MAAVAASRSPFGRIAWWNTAAWLLLVIGVAFSILGSERWERAVRSHSEQSFRAEAAGVGSTATTALQRIDDLMVAGRTLVGTNPNLTNAALATWYEQTGVEDRYPGTQGFGYVERVPAAELPRYAAAIRADPPAPAFAKFGRTLPITPGGKRASYCLIRLGVAKAAAGLLLSRQLVDLCALPGAREWLPPGGAIAVVPAAVPGLGQVLIVSAPLGHRGTDAAGQRSPAGWMLGLFKVDAVLDPALLGRRDLQISIFRQGVGSVRTAHSSLGRLMTVATVGRPPAHRLIRSRFVLDADGRWVVTVAGSLRFGWLSPPRQRAALLAGGVLLSLLVFVLVQVLGRGRGRALRMVAEKTDELRHQALHDSLTGLANRTLLSDRAEHMLTRAARQHTTPIALFIDIDGFKHVNDTLGHAAGDEVLRAYGSRLTSALRAADTVGRVGGDEFVVLFDSASPDVSAELIAERILDVLRQPIELNDSVGRTVSLTASIGVAVGPRTTADKLLRDADVALYRAKEAGRDRFVVFESAMQAIAENHLLEIDLHEALQGHQFFLLYQPIFDLESETMHGVEALLRWQHPTRGVIEPDTFIPLAESTSLIVQIGRWVLEQACHQAAEWHRNGHLIGIAVNVSARQLEDQRLVSDVRDVLGASGLAPGLLTLEITETALLNDPEVARRRVSALKLLGVRIAVDDFGSGYSSLAYLRRFAVDTLKIDRSFIADLTVSKASAALVQMFVQLGETLGLKTLAEGVEEQAQLRRLQRERCDLGQGFFFARPLDAKGIERLLAAPASG